MIEKIVQTAKQAVNATVLVERALVCLALGILSRECMIALAGS
jgi:hypothetical protein